MAATTSPKVPIRLISFNIRYATKEPFPGEEPWSIRCPRLCAQLNFETFGHLSSFICLQEVLYSQLTDIHSRLGESWGYIGRGRDADPKSGEFSPVFFRSDVWDCVRQETLWLSETPSKPSRGWDAALNRVVTLGYFTHKETGTSVTIMSTHFDHQGEKAREMSARLLVKLAHEWGDSSLGIRQNSPAPVFLGGDFNSTPEGKAYQEITRPETGMKDIRNLVSKDKRYGNDKITYTSFAGEEKQTRIDFLFALGVEKIQFHDFAILSNRFDDGVFLSDHRAVVADVEI